MWSGPERPGNGGWAEEGRRGDAETSSTGESHGKLASRWSRRCSQQRQLMVTHEEFLGRSNVAFDSCSLFD